MQTKKITTTGLAILAIVAAVSLITASSSGSLVTSAFAVKKGTDKKGTGSSSSSTSEKGTSANTGSSSSSSSTGSKSKFVKCVTAISGSPTKAQVDNCWNQVFGGGSGLTLGGSFGGGSSTGLTLGSSGGSSTSGKSSSGSSGHSSGSSSGTST